MESKKYKILFVGVFDRDKKSTNTSQLISFKKIGHDIVGYNYRQKANMIGPAQRDLDLIKEIKNNNYDLVVFSKCNDIQSHVFEKATSVSKTCLWFMDSIVNYDDSMKIKTSMVDYVCCDKINVLLEATKINKNTFLVHEGFDETVDKPYNLEKEFDVTFIGSIYGKRLSIINKIVRGVTSFSGIYNTEHAKVVSKSKINLNFCTKNDASDRVYKILAAKGFLISDDWEGREKILKDGVDLIIYQNLEDLNNKIKYYLNNEEEREKIALNGYKKIQKFNRLNWAKKIIENYEKIK